MLVPAQPYVNILLDLINDSPYRQLVFGSKDVKFYFDNTTYYYYASVDDTEKVIGLCGYQILPQSNGKGYGACRLYLINFSNDNLTFMRDFYSLITEHIFHPDNEVYSLTFDCFLGNPIINTYRRFAKKYGTILKTTATSEFYKIYKQEFWNKHKRV